MSIEISIYLCKQDTNLNDVVDREVLAEHPAEAWFEEEELNGTLRSLVLYREPASPAWAHWANESYPELRMLEIMKSDARALIYFECNNRVFLIPFGLGGRFLFHQDLIERDFGLRVVANTSDQNALKAIDILNHDAVRMRGRQQAGNAINLAGFGLDPDRDFVSAVAGEPLNHRLCNQDVSRYAGSDSLRFPCKFSLAELPGFCENLLPHYNDANYLIRYPILGKIRQLKDENEINQIETELLRQIREENYLLGFDPPDSLDNIQAHDYLVYFRAGEGLEPDLALVDLIHNLNNLEGLRAQLKSASVKRTGENQEIRLTHLFNCVAAELRSAGVNYLLFQGEWYVIDNLFLAELDADIAAIPSLGPINVDEWFDEGDFNRKFANAHGGDLLHGSSIGPPGEEEIEPCDILLNHSNFVHVKRDTVSKVLSHLFAQAYISTELLARDLDAWERMRPHIPALPANRLLPHQTQVSLIVLSERSRDAEGPQLNTSLPFFTRLNLRRLLRRMQAMQVTLNLDVVKIRKVPRP